MQMVGMLVLFGIIILILFLKNKVNNSNNTFLKTMLKINDIFVWARFLGRIFVFFIFYYFLLFYLKKDSNYF